MFIQPEPPATLKATKQVAGLHIRAHETFTYRHLHYFHYAALGLFGCGLLMNTGQSFTAAALSCWFVICGVFMIYRFNDMIDQTKDFRFNIKRITTSPLHILFLFQLIFFTLPASFIWLSPFRITLLFIIGTIGILYSVPLHIRGRVIRIKHTFLLKNITIGTLWGLLPALGADVASNTLLLSITVFSIMQVILGSVLRDIADTEHDTAFSVQTLPVVFGIPKTLLLAHTWNICALLIALILHSDLYFGIALSVVILYRSVVLLRISRSNNLIRWTHTMNLLTCLVIFFMYTLYLLYVDYI